ncbi:hypothetical protein GCM10007394_25860 [Salinibacterium amurskyense]|nr:hypothetical protein GCM10007394_25860 [Salinibacterium amurskyense]
MACLENLGRNLAGGGGRAHARNQQANNNTEHCANEQANNESNNRIHAVSVPARTDIPGSNAGEEPGRAPLDAPLGLRAWPATPCIRSM